MNRIKLVQGDLTAQDSEAIVTLLPQTLEYRGEINKALLAACGERLDKFILEHVTEPKPGDVYAVPGFGLKCKNIFFCVVPDWRDEFRREERHLLTACRRALETAREMGLKTIAFPLLASGKHGFPRQRAARLIVEAVLDRLDVSIEEIRLVCQDPSLLEVFRDRLLQNGWKG